MFQTSNRKVNINNYLRKTSVKNINFYNFHKRSGLNFLEASGIWMDNLYAIIKAKKEKRTNTTASHRKDEKKMCSTGKGKFQDKG
jgi:hypothetical protein